MMSLELAVQPPAEFPSSQTREPPRLWLAGPGGEQLSLPGTLWPAAAAHQSDPIMFAPLTRDEANRLLVAWDHPLGEYRRPFGYQAWGMAVDGRPVAVAVSGSTVSATIRTEVNGEPARVYARKEVVELARIARSHEDPRILRVMLRLWTDYLACRWPYWSVTSAVSYMLDASYEDRYGRLPHEPGYGTEPMLVAVARTPAELPACDVSHLDVPPVPERARAA